MMYPLAFLISWAQGYFLLRLLLSSSRPKLPWMLCTGLLLGLAVSAQTVFVSQLLFNQLVTGFVILVNIAIAALLGILACKQGPSMKDLFPLKECDGYDGIALIVLCALTIPTIIHASLYPYGGWDAWSCWNLKATMVFSGGEHWRNMFDPVLWRTNTAYPLLLPLMNVWVWCFGTTPTPVMPLVMSCLITFLVAGILFFSLQELTGKLWALLAPAWLLSIVFIVKLASSQYSDLLVGTLLLLTLAAFFLYQQRKQVGFLQVALLALGLMSFTKSEGLVLSVITLAVIIPTLLAPPESRRALWPSMSRLVFTGVLAFLISGIFQVFFAPNATTFVNGLSSATRPTSAERLLAVFVFLGRELVSPKWNGLWFLALGGLLLGWRRSVARHLWVIPTVVGVFFAVLVGVYWINTFFEIIWWLGTTLHRILFALIPTIIFWVFLTMGDLGVWRPAAHQKNKK